MEFVRAPQVFGKFVDFFLNFVTLLVYSVLWRRISDVCIVRTKDI